MNRNVNIKFVEDQKETTNTERNLSEEETKAFLYKHHRDMYNKMYPKEVVKSKPKKEEPKERSNYEKSNKTYKYDKYGSANVGDNNLSYKINITTDMKFND